MSEQQPRRRKKCSRCGKRKAISKFYNEDRPWCIQCFREYAIDSNRRRKYGLEPEDYEALVRLHAGCCAICGASAGQEADGRRQYLSIDHDHETNQVRGLLCNNCNRGLGLLGDGPAQVASAAVYLYTAHVALQGGPRVYLFGPMRGYAGFNHDAFFAAAGELEEQGFNVFNPAAYDRARGVDSGHLTGDQKELDKLGWSVNQALSVDLTVVTLWADILVGLPKWQDSLGAAAEVAAAKAVGKPVYELHGADLVQI